MIEIKLSGNDAQRWVDQERKDTDQIQDLMNIISSLEEERTELKEDITILRMRILKGP